MRKEEHSALKYADEVLGRPTEKGKDIVPR